MNNDIRKLIDDNWEDTKELIAQKAEEEQKPKTIWDLETKDSETYYRIEANGCIEESSFDFTYDECAREVGNAFLTREEAEFELERRNIEAIMMKHGRLFKYDKCNYYIEYYHSNDILDICRYSIISYGIPCFETREIAQKVIDEIGEGRLKKYWFGIKEGK